LAGASILAAMLLARGWVRHGTLTAAVCWAAAAALLVNLLAAGGIGFPGVAGSLWVLLALGLNLADVGKKPRTYSPHAAWIWTAAACFLAVLCYVTAYRPVLNSRVLLARANSTEMLRAPAERAELLQQALESDPRSAAVALRLAAQRFALWQQEPTPRALAAFDAAAARARELAPHSGTLWGQSGDWSLQIFQADREQKYLDAANEQYRRAVKLYPASALLRAKWAVALDAAQHPDAAREEAAEALRLDAITRQAGHEDRLLQDELRRQLKRITERQSEVAD
jgi:tetratricopeptide (TPR) repeat protein